MGILLAGVQLGNLSGGPSSLSLEDLSDVLVVSPVTSDYLRYNASISEWQNHTINSDVYGYLSTNLTGSNGVSLTMLPGPETVNISLSLAATGDATGSVTSGALPLTLATVNTSSGVPGTFGSASSIPVVTVNAKGLVTGISSVSFGGNAPLATSLAGGTTGALPYQSAASTTAFLTAGTTSQVLISGGSGPSWTNTPALSGTNFTNIPNGALTNNSITFGSTTATLGSTISLISGLTSITSSSFTGALNGNSTSSSTSAITDNMLSSSTVYPVWASADTGNVALQTSSTALSFVPSTGILSATGFAGSGAGLTSIPNSSLTHSSITLGSTSVSLGATTTTIAGLTSVTSTSFTGALTGAASANVLKAGDTMTGALILNADPVAALGAATKQYVDAATTGLYVHDAVNVSTTTNLTATYNNGASGIGATLTNSGTQAALAIDGVSLVLNNRVLVNNQTNQIQNGIYYVSNVGSGSTNWVLTRSLDADGSPAPDLGPGTYVFVSKGATNANTGWTETAIGTGPNGDITVGVDAVLFTQFSGAGSYLAGTGLSLTGTTFANTGVLSTIAGSNISVSSATGNVTIAVTGTVPSATTAANVPYSGLTGTVPTWNQNTTGNAATATALASYPGVNGSVFFNNSGVIGGTSSFKTTGNGDIALGLNGTSNGTLTLHGSGIAGSSSAGNIFLYDDLDTDLNLIISGGTSSGSLATITALTNLDIEAGTGGFTRIGTNGTERLRITPAGAISFGSSGTATGTSGQVLQSTGSGSTPIWTNTPTLTGTNFTGIPPSALTSGGSITIGSTSIALGGTSTTLAGLTSVTSTSFTGALTGNASTATSATTATTATTADNVWIANAASGFGTIQFVLAANSGTSQPLYIATGLGMSFNTANSTLSVPSVTATTGQFNGSGAGLTSIPNGALVSSAVTIGSTSVSLGTTSSSLAGLTSVGTSTVTMTNGGLTTVTYTSSATTANQVIDTMLTSAVRTVKYLVQVTSGSAYQACEILIIHDGTTPTLVEYADINTGSVLATFDATIATGNLNLVFTPVNAVTTVKVVRTTVNV
jgi:hypothetical protein